MILIDSHRYKIKIIPGLFISPGMRFMVLYRLCNRYRKSILSIPFKLLYNYNKVKYGYQIPYITNIAPGLFLGHFGNIIINSKTVIGRNCNIAQGVTIGAVNRGKYRGCPTIGNEVWIGANAVIVGKIKIGNNVLIAPLSYVAKDVPDNAVVGGNPAKILNYSGTLHYINNKI